MNNMNHVANMTATQPREKANSAGYFTANGLEYTRNDTVLFSGLNFKLYGGEMLQIQGANGSGKTSLLRILCGLTLPDKGEVHWNGKNVHEDSHDYLRDLSYIGHANGVKTELTALENLMVARAMAVPKEAVSNCAALERAGLADYENTQARKLSSGQRRRLALARLMITDARIWILDEPFAALDDTGKKLVKEMLTEHAATGGATVVATHEPVDIQHFKITIITL